MGREGYMNSLRKHDDDNDSDSEGAFVLVGLII